MKTDNKKWTVVGSHSNWGFDVSFDMRCSEEQEAWIDTLERMLHTAFKEWEKRATEEEGIEIGNVKWL